MARSHARIWLSIWADRDFLALPMHAQWLYLALPSQENINHAGVIALSPKRWTTLCTDRDPKLVDDALDILIRNRFLVIDRETEQILVRSFIRSDHVDRQPNTLKSACASILLLTSQPIRAALLDELLRLDQARIAAMRTTPGHEPAISVLRSTIAALEADGPPPDHETVTPSDGYASDGYVSDPIASDPSPRTRVGEGAGEGGKSPTDNSSSKKTPAPKRGTRATDDPATKTAHEITKAYAERVKMVNFPAVLRIVVKAVRADFPAEAITAALLRLDAAGRPVTTDTLRIELGRTNPQRDVSAVPDDQLSDDDVDEILGPGRPPEPPDEFEFWDRDRRHAWNRENYRQWQAGRRERAIRVRAERRARVTRLDDHRRSAG